MLNAITTHTHECLVYENNMHGHDKSMQVFFYLPSYSFWLVFPIIALQGFTSYHIPSLYATSAS